LRGQIIIFENSEGPIWNFLEIYWGQIENFGKFEDQNVKNYNKEEFWNSLLLGVISNSLNLTWTKYFINFHHFENSSNYYLNNGIHLNVFEFPQNITFSQNIPRSKHTLSVYILWNFYESILEGVSWRVLDGRTL
jgi:hypothetical protein